jgi:hypothetical protein
VVAVAENVKENINILLFARKATGSTVTLGRFGGVAVVDGRGSDNSMCPRLPVKGALSA